MSPAGAVAAVLVLVGAGALRAGLTARHRAPAVRRASAARPAMVTGGGREGTDHAGVAPPALRAPGLRARPRAWATAVEIAGPGVLATLVVPTGSARTWAGVVAPPGWLPARLADAGLAVTPGRAWSAWIAGAVVLTGWAAIAGGAATVVLAAVAVCAGPCLGWRLVRHRGAAGVEAALPAAVEAVAAGLRSGASLRQAVAEAAVATPGLLGSDLAQVAAATERGAGLVAALEGWADRRRLPGVRLAVAALCLCAETGGAAAQAVDAVAATLRQRLAAQAEARALATQARLSAAVIAVAPVAFCALSAAADPRASAFLLRTRMGLVLLTAGLALDAAGALWMARLTRVEL